MALALSVMARIASARYNVPPSLAARLAVLRDPVVTCGSGLLRFEAFSNCGSAYARVDLLPDACRGATRASGTTNVDFNGPFRAALGQVLDDESVSLMVGREGVSLVKGADQWIERPVLLPARWVRGFCEVQAFQSRMRRVAEVGRAEWITFLRSLVPLGNPSATTCYGVIPRERRLSVGAAREDAPVKLTGIARLRVLESLVPWTHSVSVFADPLGGASEWVLNLGEVRLHLALCSHVERGFSGEGQVLRSLAQDCGSESTEKVRACLSWQAALHPTELARQCHLTVEEASHGLATLASQGLAGFDVTANAWFHRVLPFDAALASRVHPRLVSARRLLEEGSVSVTDLGDGGWSAIVSSNGTPHRAQLNADGSGWCTCPWIAKHRLSRGPCKHILAALLARGENEQ